MLHSLIASLDLSAVRKDLLTRDKMSEERADTAIQRYREFLDLHRRYRDLPLCCPSDVDLVWHRHMLRSAAYRNDCQTLFGAPLDHDPDAFGTAAFASAWAETRRLWLMHFDVALVEDATALDTAALAPAACAILLNKMAA